ncbi:MAG: AtpZ/AtpI family protein [Hyphomonas sp.]|nr:AtpZ/AtpI family protein [Hyphomonas sp.]
MTQPDDEDPMVQQVRLRRAREDAYRKQGHHSVASRLAQIGVLGWIIITPTLLGIFIGRWIDQQLGTGVFWTAPLLMAGVGLGGWSAWKWMNNS